MILDASVPVVLETSQKGNFSKRLVSVQRLVDR
jgi:hypothetical protein